MSRRLVSFICAVLVAGCGSPSLPPAGGSAAAVRLATVRHRARVVFRIKIPKRKTHRGRGDRYVSPATQAMTVMLTGPTAVNQTVGLTPTTGGCASELATTVCTFADNVEPGQYHATLKTYDAVSGCPGACTIPGGANELSAAQLVPFTVTPGIANEIALTLSGVPASILVTPATGTSIRNASGAIDLVGTGAHKIFAEALDADGNVIFGPGAPAFSVAAGAGTLNVTIGQPSSASPNEFTLTPPALPASGHRALTVTANYSGQATDGCAQPNAVCSANVVVDLQQLFATYSFSKAYVFVTGQTSPLVTISSGAINATALAFDGSGNLFIALCNVGCNSGSSADAIAVYAPPYTGAPTYITNGVYGPQSLAVDSSGQLLVGNCVSCYLGFTDTLAIFTPPFTASSVPSATNNNGFKNPVAMVFDGSGNLFVANCGSCGPGGGDSVKKYASPYTGAPVTLAAVAVGEPTSLALDGSANLFVSDPSHHAVDEFIAPAYTTANSVAKAADTTSFVDPVAVVADAGGSDVLVVDNSLNKVFECGPPFGATCGSGATISTAISGPVAAIEDGAGNLYVANRTGNNITSYAAGAFTGTATPISANNFTPLNLAVLP